MPLRPARSSRPRARSSRWTHPLYLSRFRSQSQHPGYTALRSCSAPGACASAARSGVLIATEARSSTGPADACSARPRRAPAPTGAVVALRWASSAEKAACRSAWLGGKCERGRRPAHGSSAKSSPLPSSAAISSAENNSGSTRYLTGISSIRMMGKVRPSGLRSGLLVVVRFGRRRKTEYKSKLVWIWTSRRRLNPLT